MCLFKHSVPCECTHSPTHSEVRLDKVIWSESSPAFILCVCDEEWKHRLV